MGRAKIPITKSEIKLHKPFVPVIQKNRAFIRDGALIAVRNLAFAKKILNRYSGFSLYDFDFSAFVFLENILREAQEEEQRKHEIMQVKNSIQVCKVYQQQMHLSSWQHTVQLYQHDLILLEHMGNVSPSFVAQHSSESKQSARLPQLLYITSSLFQKTVQHLQYGLRIAPAQQRMRVEFRQQIHVWQQMQQWYADTLPNLSGNRDGQDPLQYSLVRQASGETEQKQELSPLSVNVDSVQPWRTLYQYLEQVTSVTHVAQGDQLPGHGEKDSRASQEHQQWSEQHGTDIEQILIPMVEQKQLLWHLFQKAVADWQQSSYSTIDTVEEMESHEWQKLCLMKAIRSYEEQQASRKQSLTVEEQTQNLYTQIWLEDLVYRMQLYDEQEWNTWVQQLKRTPEMIAQLHTVQQYVHQQGKKGHGNDDFVTSVSKFLQSSQSQNFSVWVHDYERMLQRHTLVHQAILQYEQQIQAQPPQTFQQRKQLLVEQLQKCRKESQVLFDISTQLSYDVRKITKEVTDIWPFLHHQTHLQEKMVQFEYLSSEQLREVERLDITHWEQWISQLHKWYHSSYDLSVEVSHTQRTLHLLHCMVDFQHAWEDLQKILRYTDVTQLVGLLDKQREIVHADNVKLLLPLLRKNMPENETTPIASAPFSVQQRTFLLEQVQECAVLLEDMQVHARDFLQQEQQEQVQLIRSIMQQHIYAEIQQREEMQQKRIRRRWQFEVEQWQQRCTTLSHIFKKMEQHREEGAWHAGSGEEQHFFVQQLHEQEVLHEGVWQAHHWHEWQVQMLDTDLGRNLTYLLPQHGQTMQAEVIDLFTRRGQDVISSMHQQKWVEWLTHVSHDYSDEVKMIRQQQHLREMFRTAEFLDDVQNKEHEPERRWIQQIVQTHLTAFHIYEAYQKALHQQETPVRGERSSAQALELADNKTFIQHDEKIWQEQMTRYVQEHPQEVAHLQVHMEHTVLQKSSLVENWFHQLGIAPQEADHTVWQNFYTNLTEWENLSHEQHLHFLKNLQASYEQLPKWQYAEKVLQQIQQPQKTTLVQQLQQVLQKRYAFANVLLHLTEAMENRTIKQLISASVPSGLQTMLQVLEKSIQEEKIESQPVEQRKQLQQLAQQLEIAPTLLEAGEYEQRFVETWKKAEHRDVQMLHTFVEQIQQKHLPLPQQAQVQAEEESLQKAIFAVQEMQRSWIREPALIAHRMVQLFHTDSKQEEPALMQQKHTWNVIQEMAQSLVLREEIKISAFSSQEMPLEDMVQRERVPLVIPREKEVVLPYHEGKENIVFRQQDVQDVVVQEQMVQKVDTILQQEEEHRVQQQKHILKLKQIVEKQEEEITQLSQMQKKMELRLQEKEEQLNVLQSGEKSVWERMSERLQNEMRMERLRKGMQ